MDDDDDLFGEMMEAQLLQDEDLDHPSSSSSSSSPPLSLPSSLLSKPSSYFQPRPPHQLAGLTNTGATCYLNSLLQALYHAPEFRAALYELDEAEIGVPAYEEEQRAKGRGGEDGGHEGGRREEGRQEEQDDDSKVEVSEVDVSELVSMGFDETKVRRALQRFPSLDQREAAIDLILSLPADESPPPTSSSTPPSSSTSSSTPSPSPAFSSSAGRAYRRIPIAFRLFFSNLQLLDHASLPTTLITSAFGWTDRSISVQHDIHELFTRLCEAMEGSLKGLRSSSLISSLFSGALRRTLTCDACGDSRARHEDFYSLHMPIAGCRNIHSSLAKVFEREQLMLGCDRCEGRRSTSSSTVIDRFPFLLTFALGRHEYDRAKGVRVKLGDDFAFPLVLDMSLYGDAVHDDQRRVLEKDLLTLHSPSHPHADDRKRKVTAGDDGAEYQLLPSHYDPASPHLYDLFAVIIHAGSAHSGHYFAYIRDVLREAVEPREGGWWWKFNDSQVSSMDVQLIASQYGGKKESAYMLMYRHRTPHAPPPSVPTVPPALVAAAASYNAQLEVDRARYEEFKHAVRVVVWLENAVTLKGDKVIEVEREAASSASVTTRKREEEETKEAEGKKGGKGGGRKQQQQQEGKKGGKTEEKTAKQQRKEEEEAKKEEQRRAAELVVAEAEEEKREEERKGKYTFVVDERLPVDAFVSLVRERLRWRDDERGGELRLNRAARLEEEGEEEGRRLEGSLPYPGMQEREEERIPDDQLHLSPSPLRQSLADLGVRHGDVLLAWNGRSLHSSPFFTGIQRPLHLRFSLRWVRSADPSDVLELTCHLPAEAVLQDMVELVRRRIGGAGDLHLFLLTKRALTPIDLSLTHLHLADVDVSNASTLVLEVTPPSSPPSSIPTLPTLAYAYFHAQSSRVKLIVQDRVSSSPSPSSSSSTSSLPTPPDLTLRLDKSLTLHQLKLLLLSSLPSTSTLTPTLSSSLSPSPYSSPFSPPAPHLCRLRKMTGHNRLGPVLTPESLTLTGAELDDDDVMVRLEWGRLPKESELDVVVSLEGVRVDVGEGVGGEEDEVVVGGLDQVPVMCEKRWTVKQVKQAILDAAQDGRPETGFVLYRGDAAGVAKDKLLANEFITLDRLHMHHGDSLFLHVGELPLQGKVVLDVFVYAPSLVVAELPSLVQLMAKWGDGEEVKEERVEQEVVRATVDTGLDTSSPASTLDMPTRSSLLSFLLTLPFSSAASLLDLKTAIHSLSALSSLPSPSHLRIRTLNKADELHSLLTDDSLPLKRQGIGTDRRLAVQLLAAPELNVLPSALLLRTMLVLPQKRGSGVQLVPAGGVELLFSEAAHPQVRDLKRWAARQVELSEDAVVVLKWLSGERRWKVVWEGVGEKGDGHGEEMKRPPSAEPAPSRKGGGNQQGKGAAVPSLLTAPYHLHQQGQRRSASPFPSLMPRCSFTHLLLCAGVAVLLCVRSGCCAVAVSVPCAGVCGVCACGCGVGCGGRLRGVAFAHPARGRRRRSERRGAQGGAQAAHARRGGTNHRLLTLTTLNGERPVIYLTLPV